jgi:ribosome biogenesis protein BMS1
VSYDDGESEYDDYSEGESADDDESEVEKGDEDDDRDIATADSESDDNDDDFTDSDDEEGEGEDEEEDEEEDFSNKGAEWKKDMKGRASSAFLDRAENASSSGDIMKLIYGSDWMLTGGHHDEFKAREEGDNDHDDDDDEDDDDDLFRTKSVLMQNKKAKYDKLNAVDSTRAVVTQEIIDRWSSALSLKKGRGSDVDDDDYDEDDHDGGNEDNSDERETKDAARLLIANIRNKFVTGDWSQANKVKSALDSDGEGGSDSEYGDFEDLETGEKNSGRSKEADESDDFDYGSDNDGEDGSDSGEESEDSEAANDEIDRKLREENMKKKASKKENFDKEYDDSKQQLSAKEKSDLEAEEAVALEAIKKKYEEQRERNKREFGEDGEEVRFQYEGYRQGIYVRILVRGVPVEFTESFRSEIPVILGGKIVKYFPVVLSEVY